MEKNEGSKTTELAVKCRSKTEFYNLLIREGKICLPPKQDAAQSYLRNIIIGDWLYLC